MNISNGLRRKFVGFACGWGLLGFYRGTQHYDYTHKEQLQTYREKIKRYSADKIRYPDLTIEKPIEPAKYIISTMANGLYGSFCYLYPVVNVVYVIKEFYRAEIYLRNLKEEKTKRYYNTLDVFD